MNKPAQHSDQAINVSLSMRLRLTELAEWAKKMADISYCVIGLLFFVSFLHMCWGIRPFYLDIGLLYLCFGIFIYFPTQRLVGFSNNIKDALSMNHEELLEQSFEQLRFYYKSWSFLMLACLIFLSFSLFLHTLILF